MMTQQLGFSVLSAPLAAIDRRSLSQAWYSALHLAHDAPASHAAHTAVHASIPHGAPENPQTLAPRGPQRVPPVAVRVQRTVHERRTLDAAVADRRVRRSPLSRKIEYAFLHPAKRCERATFTLEGTNARVHVTLQGAGADLRLVAICPPAVRARVARALEEARYALALRGVACALDVKEA